LLAFGSGPLNGIGFAGALHETGLPQNGFCVALLVFNLGVAAGQRACVAVMPVMVRALSAIPGMLIAAPRQVTLYSLGTGSMVCLVTRRASSAVTWDRSLDAFKTSMERLLAAGTWQICRGVRPAASRPSERSDAIPLAPVSGARIRRRPTETENSCRNVCAGMSI
jgi:hypothetical protein